MHLAYRKRCIDTSIRSRFDSGMTAAEYGILVVGRDQHDGSYLGSK